MGGAKVAVVPGFAWNIPPMHGFYLRLVRELCGRGFKARLIPVPRRYGIAPFLPRDQNIELEKTGHLGLIYGKAAYDLLSFVLRV